MKRIQHNSQDIDWNNPDSIDNYRPEDEAEYLPEAAELHEIWQTTERHYSAGIPGEIKDIYLYPCTTNSLFLSELINVPEDTLDRLDYIKEQAQEEQANWRREYAERIQHDDDLLRLDKFLTTGWGKFTVPPGFRYGDTIDVNGCKPYFDKETAALLFESSQRKEWSKHISFERILLLAEGFYWY